MGIFDAFKSGPVEFTEKEAFIGVIVAAIGADGEIADEEISSLVSIMNRLPSYKSDFSFVQNTYNKCVKTIKASGSSGLLDLVVPKLNKDIYQTTFTQAIDIVIADGQVGKEEEEFIGKLQSMLSLEDSFAQNAVAIVSIKNKIF